MSQAWFSCTPRPSGRATWRSRRHQQNGSQHADGRCRAKGIAKAPRGRLPRRRRRGAHGAAQARAKAHAFTPLASRHGATETPATRGGERSAITLLRVRLD